ncbi:MAG: shikimate kinase [Clostridium sp.]|uniref:shikimate kinase n=1 Tax=Clostridium sp. TaxID=1506 RepID=UPI003F2D4DE8
MCKRCEKIFLIGMPGCGKTTMGKVLAKELKYNFFDMDDYIEEMSDRSIKEIFDQSEEKFRDLETEACKRLLEKKRVLVSTGGGVIKRKENIALMKEGLVIFINRPIEKIIQDIDVESRPLLNGGAEKLYSLYNERIDKYLEACDIEVVNEGFIRDTIDTIKRELKGKIKE